jgi:hypothetical protein
MRTKRLLDREIERLLVGAPVQDRDLALLSPVVDGLRTLAGNQPAETEVRSFAARAAVVVMERSQRPADAAASHRRRQRVGLTPRLAAALMAVLMVPATAGAALAADSAIPGDPLYGLDRAFEVVGIGAGSTEERLTEAVQLAENGKGQDALGHAILALQEDSTDAEARQALQAVADQLSSLDTSGVLALLAYIADNAGNGLGTDGREFGQGVAEMAREINGDEAPDDASNGNTGGRPDQPGTVDPGPQGPTIEPPGQGGDQPGQPDATDEQPGADGSQGENGQDNGQGNGQGQGNSNGNGQGQGQGNGNAGNSSSDDPVPPVESGNAPSEVEPPQEEPTDEPSVEADPVAPDPEGDDLIDDAKNKGKTPRPDSPSITAPGQQGRL